MHISEQLIEKFFTGDCTASERQAVLNYFRKNPEEFAGYISEQDWEKFEAYEQEVPSEKMLRNIEKRISKTTVWYHQKSWRVAASVIFLAGLFSLFYLLSVHNQHTLQPSTTFVQNLSDEAKEVPMVVVQNTGKKIIIYKLSDGSQIELAANSSVRFHNPFINNSRDIYLQGKALFTVAKDKSKPFVVHSKDITTTALGTVFSVSENDNKYTAVRLFSGRIVVKKDTAARGSNFNDVYLMPGQQLLLDKTTFLAKVNDVIDKKPTIKKIAKPVLRQQFILSFNNQPLSEIFIQLQEKYNVSIVYDVSDMQQISFTGTHDSAKESLEDFLHTLCILNELTLSKSDETTFTVTVK